MHNIVQGVRNSNIELLCIICIAMIIVMHVYGQYRTIDSRVIYHSSMLCNAFCNAAVSIFVLISGYYGIRSNMGKWLSLYNVTTFYAIMYLLYYIVLPNHFVDLTLTVKCLFPVFCNKYWFITSYLMLMALAGFIQRALDGLTQNGYKKLILVLSVFVILSPTLFFMEIFNDSGKGFMNMLTIYIIGRYIARFGLPSSITRYAKILIPVVITLIWLLDECFSQNIFCRDNSLLIVILAVLVFHYIVQKPTKYSEVINYLATFVFSIYLIHCIFLNDLVMLMKQTDYPYMVQIWSSVLILMIVSIMVEFLRKTLLGGGIFVDTNSGRKAVISLH